MASPIIPLVRASVRLLSARCHLLASRHGAAADHSTHGLSLRSLSICSAGVDFLPVDGSGGTGTGTGIVQVGTCCEPLCEQNYKPAPAVGRTADQAVCATDSLAVVCTQTDCEAEGPRPAVDISAYSGLRGVCVFFSVLAVLAIGANNFGNAVGIAVASQATTLRFAATLAVVFELFGALIGNSWGAQNVIFNDLVDLDVFGDNPEILMQAMVCVSMAVAAVMLGFAALGIPVSVTQVTVGGMVGVVNVWQNRVATERATLAAAGAMVPQGGCGTDGTQDCVDWDTVFVRMYIVGCGAPVIAGMLAWFLRRFVVGSGDNVSKAGQVMLALLWGFPLLYILFTQILERAMAISEPPAVTLLKGNQPSQVAWFNSGIELTSFSAWDNGDGNPWLAIIIFVFLLFGFIASTVRCLHASCGRGGRSRVCCGYNVNGVTQILA